MRLLPNSDLEADIKRILMTDFNIVTLLTRESVDFLFYSIISPLTINTSTDSSRLSLKRNFAPVLQTQLTKERKELKRVKRNRLIGNQTTE